MRIVRDLFAIVVYGTAALAIGLTLVIFWLAVIYYIGSLL